MLRLTARSLEAGACRADNDFQDHTENDELISHSRGPSRVGFTILARVRTGLTAYLREATREDFGGIACSADPHQDL